MNDKSFKITLKKNFINLFKRESKDSKKGKILSSKRHQVFNNTKLLLEKTLSKFLTEDYFIESNVGYARIFKISNKKNVLIAQIFIKSTKDVSSNLLIYDKISVRSFDTNFSLEEENEKTLILSKIYKCLYKNKSSLISKYNNFYVLSHSLSKKMNQLSLNYTHYSNNIQNNVEYTQTTYLKQKLKKGITFKNPIHLNILEGAEFSDIKFISLEYSTDNILLRDINNSEYKVTVSNIDSFIQKNILAYVPNIESSIMRNLVREAYKEAQQETSHLYT